MVCRQHRAAGSTKAAFDRGTRPYGCQVWRVFQQGHGRHGWVGRASGGAVLQAWMGVGRGEGNTALQIPFHQHLSMTLLHTCHTCTGDSLATCCTMECFCSS